MKKIIALWMVVLLFGLTACGAQKNNADWTEGEIQFDGKVFRFPFKLSELEELGWRVPEGRKFPEATEVVKYRDISLENDKYDSQTIKVSVDLKSNAEGKGGPSEYDVMALSVMMLYVDDEEPKPIVSVNGLSFGDSKEKIIEILGNPELSNEMEDLTIYGYDSWKEEPKNNHCYMTIGFTAEGIKVIMFNYLSNTSE